MKRKIYASGLILLAACKSTPPIEPAPDALMATTESAYVLFTVNAKTDAAGSLESAADKGFKVTFYRLERSGKSTEFSYAKVKPGQPYVVMLAPGVYYMQGAVFRDWSETFLPQPTLFNVKRGQVNYAGDISIVTQYTHNSTQGNQVTNWYSRYQEVDDNQATIDWFKQNYPTLAGQLGVRYTHIYDTSQSISK